MGEKVLVAPDGSSSEDCPRLLECFNGWNMPLGELKSHLELDKDDEDWSGLPASGPGMGDAQQTWRIQKNVGKLRKLMWMYP